ncbi:hypothetical protein BaRGS_00036672, partial [Batillaria attramentaria]
MPGSKGQRVSVGDSDLGLEVKGKGLEVYVTGRELLDALHELGRMFPSMGSLNVSVAAIQTNKLSPILPLSSTGREKSACSSEVENESVWCFDLWDKFGRGQSEWTVSGLETPGLQCGPDVGGLPEAYLRRSSGQRCLLPGIAHVIGRPLRDHRSGGDGVKEG